MNRPLIVLSAFLFLGCTSSLKKNCESANWYERGYKIAKKGHFPDGDFYLKKCEKEGAHINSQQLDVGFKKGRDEICDPKVAKNYGKEGKKYNFPICMNYNDSQMLKAYKSGQRQFCQPNSIYKWGLSGQPYEGSCESNSEELLKKFMSGRKKYYKNSLRAEKKKIKKIEANIASLKDKRKGLKEKLDNTRMFKDEKHRALSEYKQLGFDVSNAESAKNESQGQINQLNEELSKL